MGHGIGRHHHGGGADGGVQIGGDLRQQRIHHPHLGLAGKAGDREQDDERVGTWRGDGIVGE